MANAKISDLTAATTLGLADLFEVEQGGASKRGTLDLLRLALNAPLVATLAADETRNNTATPTDAALSVAVEANTDYRVEIEGTYLSPTVTPDLRWGLTVPAGATYAVVQAASSATGAALNTATLVAGTLAASAEAMLFARGRVRIGATAGNVTVRWSQDVATVEDTVLKKGAQLRLYRLGAV